VVVVTAPTVKPVGAFGAVLAAVVVAVTEELAAEVPAEFTASTVYVYEDDAVRPVSVYEVLVVVPTTVPPRRTL
jgi:hypothetical protein